MRKALSRAVAPPIHLITQDVTLTSTPYSLAVDIPAGAYEIKAVLCIDNAALPSGVSQNLSFFIFGGTAVRLGWNQVSWRSPSTVPSMQSTLTNLSGSGFSISMAASGTRVRYHGFGLVEMSKLRSFSIRLTMPVDTCVLRAGSFLRAEPRA